MARQDFVTQLTDMGFYIEEHGNDRLSFPYQVPAGKFQGQSIRLGFEVHEDFPLSPPSGPHVSPRLLPINTTSKEHPLGGVHESPFGAEWEYWSRPHPNWSGTDHTVKAYMIHIRKLFETQ
jgi:hypothetical protein